MFQVILTVSPALIIGILKSTAPFGLDDKQFVELLAYVVDGIRVFAGPPFTFLVIEDNIISVCCDGS